MCAVVTDEVGVVLTRWSAIGGSNNIAELTAIDLACQLAVDNGWQEVTIRSDSRIAMIWARKPLGKKSRAGDPATVRQLQASIHGYRSRLSDLRMEWVPRHLNWAGHILEYGEVRRYMTGGHGV
jgi:ribonuclease HI